jgi:phenylalanyl-tRNA synthetase beta chain
VFVDRADQILSMPPILNSESFGRVTTKTTDCFIEVTGLDLVNITRMLDIICCVFADMGGDIYQVQIKMGAKKLVTPAFSAKKVSISTKQIATRMGVELSAKEVGVLLEKMGYHIVSHKTSAKNTSFELTAPCYRGDIWHDVDIIDDIIRAYGVNNIPMRFPAVATTGGVTNRTRVVDAVTDILVGHGLVEIRTLGVTDKADQFDKMNLGAMPHISLGSTADKGINMVRCGLLAESLKLLSHNRSVPTPHKIFEVGDVLIPDAKADVRSRNVTKLCVVLGGDGITYTNARQVLESLLSDFGLLTAVTYAAQKHPSFIDGRCADVLVHGKSIGILGEISVKVLENWGFEYPIACFEIDLSTLI